MRRFAAWLFISVALGFTAPSRAIAQDKNVATSDDVASEKLPGSDEAASDKLPGSDEAASEKLSGSDEASEKLPGSDEAASGKRPASDGGPQQSGIAPPKGDTSPFTRDSFLRLGNIFVLRFTPVGFENQAQLGFSKPLYERQDKLFFNTHYGASLLWKINPSFTRVGAALEFQPIAFFKLRGGYEYARYFGLFGFPHSYPAPTSSFPDDLKGTEVHSGYSTGGHHVFVEPTLQIIAGQVALISRWAFEYWNLELAEGDEVFYDTIVGALVPGRGWVVSTDTDLAYLRFRVVGGIRYSGVWPQYSDDLVAAASGDPGAASSRHRLGPFLAYPFGTGKARLKAPALTLLTGWYLGGSSLAERQRFYALLAFSFSIGVGK